MSCPKFCGCGYCCALCQECCERCIVTKPKKHPHIEYRSPEEANRALRTPLFELPQKERWFPLHPISSTGQPTEVVKKQPTALDLDECPLPEDDFEMQVFDKKPRGPLTHEQLGGITDSRIPESLPADSRRGKEGQATEPVLQYSLIYDIQLRSLNVHLHKATNLLAKGASGSVDPFVVAFLLPSKEAILQTEVVEKNSNPHFDTVLKFQGIALKDIHQMILVLQVFDHDRFLKDQLIGTVVVALKKADLYGSSVTAPINGDKELMEPFARKGFKILCRAPPPRVSTICLPDVTARDQISQAFPHRIMHTASDKRLEKYSHGGLLLSLNYNLPMQQLEGTIIKITNIPRHHRWGYTDPYVKVYLMHDGLRRSKWKSSVQRYSPVIRVDESFSIDMAGVNISNAYLEVRVLCHSRLSRDDILCRVCIGPHSQQESGQSHWSEMILSPSQEFSKWHAFILYDSSERRSRSKSPQELFRPHGRHRSGTL